VTFGLRPFDLTSVIAKQLESIYNIHPIDNFTENDMPAIKPRSWNGGDEELGAISAFSESCQSIDIWWKTIRRKLVW
jgi:hypothetical protein